jgi:alpha/beta superfamily hydrolase
MFPLFFGSSPNLLFGAHSSPSKAARDTGVVIVPPMGQEAIRAHRAIRQLGLRLSRERFHALRFDLRGTGDGFHSSGSGSAQRSRVEPPTGDATSTRSSSGSRCSPARAT